MQTEHSFSGYASIYIRYHYNKRRLHIDRCKTNRLIGNTQCILSTFNTDIRLWIVWLIAFLRKGLGMRLKWIKEAIHRKKLIKWRRNLNSRTHKNVLETTLSLTKNSDLFAVFEIKHDLGFPTSKFSALHNKKPKQNKKPNVHIAIYKLRHDFHMSEWFYYKLMLLNPHEYYLTKI